MNRQEAAIIIKAIGKHAIETHLTEPGDIVDATVMAVEALVPKPDEVTGLMPCGCGGEVYPHYQLGWCHESGVQAFEVSTGCDGCGTYTKPRRGHYVNGIDKDDTELASKRDWNTSHGFTAPPLPGAIGPETDETAPNGDKGAES